MVLSNEVYPHVEISFQTRKIVDPKQYKNPNFIHILDIDSNCSCAHGSPLLAAAAATRADRPQPASAEKTSARPWRLKDWTAVATGSIDPIAR
jgi:hypothetical protein